MNFDEYYKKYLGCQTFKERYVSSIFRNMPINQSYFYPLIHTTYKSSDLISVSPEIFNDKDLALTFNDIKTKSLERLKNTYNQIIEKKFYRFSYDNNFNIHSSSAESLNSSHYDIFMNSGNNTDKHFKEKKWQSLKLYREQGRIFVQIYDNQIISTCKISDIYCNGANLYVHTNEKYRKKGFGTSVVNAATIACLRKNLIPIYFAEISNIASINLALSTGFSLKATESCFCGIK